MILPLLLSLLLAAPPLVLTIRQTVGMAPLTLRVKVKAEATGKEVCIVIGGPEDHRSCRTLDGITWTTDFFLRNGGEYSVFANIERYRTPTLTVLVIGGDATSTSRAASRREMYRPLRR